jgi:S1-C subfamily serine protease
MAQNLRSLLVNRAVVGIVVGLTAANVVASVPARADNQMGYRLLTDQDAQQLPRNHGALGLDIERAQQITDSGMTFDIIRITNVRPGLPGERAGFHRGDDIVAVDGYVFASLNSFGDYVGSLRPGQAVVFDAIPANGGPAQAERITVTVSATGDSSPPGAAGASSGGLSTRAKIGLGVAALFGCYELGCFSHGPPQSGTAPAR